MRLFTVRSCTTMFAESTKQITKSVSKYQISHTRPDDLKTTDGVQSTVDNEVNYNKLCLHPAPAPAPAPAMPGMSVPVLPECRTALRSGSVNIDTTIHVNCLQTSDNLIGGDFYGL